MKIFKQIYIDNGTLGGIISILSASSIIMTPISFIGVINLNYDKSFKWMNPILFWIITTFIMGLWLWFYFAIIFPSILKFQNRQGYAHGNPLKEELRIVNEKLDRLLNGK